MVIAHAWMHQFKRFEQPSMQACNFCYIYRLYVTFLRLQKHNYACMHVMYTVLVQWYAVATVMNNMHIYYVMYRSHLAWPCELNTACTCIYTVICEHVLYVYYNTYLC